MINKEFLCDSCSFASIEIHEVYKPIYATSQTVHKVKEYTIFCKQKFEYIGKLVTWKKYKEKGYCKYRPKAGKIGKKTLQKTLMEN
jgi:hypothetical protein